MLSCAGNDTNSEQLSSRLLSLRRLFSVLFCFNVRKENKYFKPSIISSSWWKQVQVILNTFRLFQEYSYFDCSGKVSVCKTVLFNSSQEMLNETWNRPITYRKSKYFVLSYTAFSERFTEVKQFFWGISRFFNNTGHTQQALRSNLGIC